MYNTMSEADVFGEEGGGGFRQNQKERRRKIFNGL